MPGQVVVVDPAEGGGIGTLGHPRGPPRADRGHAPAPGGVSRARSSARWRRRGGSAGRDGAQAGTAMTPRMRGGQAPATIHAVGPEPRAGAGGPDALRRATSAGRGSSTCSRRARRRGLRRRRGGRARRRRRRVVRGASTLEPDGRRAGPRTSRWRRRRDLSGSTKRLTVGGDRRRPTPRPRGRRVENRAADSGPRSTWRSSGR